MSEGQTGSLSLEQKREHNSFAYVSRLPGELICRIILEYKAVALDDSTGPRSPFQWMKIAQICHHWREICLNFKQLWAEIKINEFSPHLTLMMLERSDPGPIFVSISPPRWPRSEPSTDILKALGCQTSRIKTLDVGTYPQAFNSLINYLPASAPSLHTLSVQLFCPANYEGSAAPVVECAKLFPDGAPCLKALSIRLYDTPISWASSLFSTRGLTKFVLAMASSDTNVVNAMALVELLESMPDLVELTLSFPKAFNSSAPFSRPHRLTFPSLKEFHLYGFPTGLQRLLDHISYPPFASVSLRLSACKDITVDEFSQILSSLFSSDSLPSPVSKWKPNFLHYGSWGIRGSRAGFWPTEDQQPPGFKLTLPSLSEIGQATQFLLALPWSLTNITILTLYRADHNITNIARHLSSVHKIIALPMCRAEAFSSLAQQFGDENPVSGENPNKVDAAERLYFPHLSHLVFQGVDLDKDPNLVVHVRSWLELRLKVESPISTLLFEQCQSSETGWLEQFKTLVAGEIVWNG